MVATPEVAARPWKGNAGDIVGVIGEKVLTAAVKVGRLCMSIPFPPPPPQGCQKKKKKLICLSRGKGKKGRLCFF